jgi:hypothetical protein
MRGGIETYFEDDGPSSRDLRLNCINVPLLRLIMESLRLQFSTNVVPNVVCRYLI